MGFEKGGISSSTGFQKKRPPGEAEVSQAGLKEALPQRKSPMKQALAAFCSSKNCLWETLL
jgi:hypothetical protein